MNTTRISFLMVVAALVCQGEGILGQETVNPRIRRNFNAGWLFQRQSKGTGELGSFDREVGEAGQIEPRFRGAFKPDYDDSGWERIDLPHTWNAHDTTDEKPGYWRGIGWYRKHFSLNPSLSGKRVFVEFEGVNSVSEFWLNGYKLGEHKGGYTGFEFDVTDKVRFEPQENVLAVKVDNLYHATVPPTVKTDYTFYGGIYRYAWIRTSESTYLADVVWTTPSVSQESAEVRIESKLINAGDTARSLTLVHEIFDPANQLVKTISSRVGLAARQNSTVIQSTGPLGKPKLWSPDSPNLYRIRSFLREGDRLVDLVENPLGFRWFKFDPQKGFFLNGKRVQIQGTNWHQVYPGMGNALPKSRHVKDMEMIREMGANFWRTSHYPHDPATLEASDRLGLMVWEELPVNKEIGDPDEYIRNTLHMAEEMIHRDRKHPAIILWGIAGEINAPTRVARQVVEAVAKKYRELDPTRPVAMHQPRAEGIESLVDVVGLGVSKEADEKHLKYPDRSYMTSEYAVATIGRGIYGSGPDSEERGCEENEKYLSSLMQRPWMAGGLIWHQFDYEGETYDTVIPHIVAFGMTDVWRIPKDVYYFYQSQWSERPMVHIVGHWTWPGDEGQAKPVKVYGNADEVELFLNGDSLGVQRDSSRLGLLHAPRLWNVPYRPGTLKAVARTQGSEIADERKTAGPAHHIVLQSDTDELRSGDPESLAYLTASVVDENGTVVPTSSHAITFTQYGPGALVEQTWLGHGTGLTWNAVAGMTRVAFRANRTGHAVVSVYSPGLRTGRKEIRVVAAGEPDEMEYVEKFAGDEP